MTAMDDLVSTLTLTGDAGDYLSQPRTDAAFLPAGTLAALCVMGAVKALPDMPIRSIHSLFLRVPAPSARSRSPSRSSTVAASSRPPSSG